LLCYFLLVSTRTVDFNSLDIHCHTRVALQDGFAFLRFHRGRR
jgi:hypothetical protein